MCDHKWVYSSSSTYFKSENKKSQHYEYRVCSHCGEKQYRQVSDRELERKPLRQ